MSTLHDRITALADEMERLALVQRGTDYGMLHGDVGRRLRAVLAETTTCEHGSVVDQADGTFCASCHAGPLAETATAKPEADAVERAARAMRMWLMGLGSLSLAQVDDLAPKFARAALAAAQPVEPPVTVCASCGEARDDVLHCSDCYSDAEYGPPQSVEPEPDEREALARLLWERRGGSISGAPSWDDPTIFKEAVKESWRQEADVILAAGFRRSRPDVTHTVTAEQVARLMEELAALDTLAEQAESLAFDPTHSGMATAYRLAARGVRAALGVTVVDTPRPSRNA